MMRPLDAGLAPLIGNGTWSQGFATDLRGGPVRVVTSLPLLVLASIAAGFVTSAQAGFHLELGGALMHLDGPRPISIDSSGVNGFPSASQLYGLGPGFKVGASVDLGRRFALAGRTGLLQARDERAVVLTPAFPDTGAIPQFPGTFRNKLTLIPTHLILRYRLQSGRRAALHAQVGAGVIAFTEKAEIIATSGATARDATYQTSFSVLVGAGAAYSLYRGVAIDLGLDFYQALPGEGDIWRSGDRPRFGVATLGLRYPL